MTATSHPYKPKVFISYSRVDASFAEELTLGLEDKGYEVEIDKHSIRQGEEWKARLGKLIAGCDTVVFVLSPDSARSPICNWEVEQALAFAKRVIPVLHRGLSEPPKGKQQDGTPWPEGLAAAPPHLALLNYPRFDEGRSFMAGLKGLVQALEDDLDWIERHSRLAARARDWDDGGRPANRLMSGPDISAAKTLVEMRKSTAPPMLAVQMDFIHASEANETAQTSARERDLEERRRLAEDALASSRRLVQRTLAGLVAAALLATVAAVAGGMAWLQQHEAVVQRAAAEREAAAAQKARVRAERSEDAAQATTREAQTTQSGLLANAARAILDQPGGDDAQLAMLLALEGMPDQASDDPRQRTRPRVSQTQLRLDQAYRLAREKSVLGKEGGVGSVAWSPDGRFLATASRGGAGREGEVRIEEVASGKQITRLPNKGWSAAVSWSPDGRMLATLAGYAVHVVDPRSGHTATHNLDVGNNAVAWSPDGRRLAMASRNSGKSVTQIVEASTGEQLVQFANDGWVDAVAWSSDGRLLAISQDSADRTRGDALILEAATGKEVGRVAHDDRVSAVAWSPDGTRVASATYSPDGQKGEARIIEAETSKEIARLARDDGSINTLAWSPDGRFLAMGGKTTVVVEASTGNQMSRLTHRGEALTLAWSPEGRWLAIGTANASQGEVRVVGAATGRVVARVGQEGWVRTVAWSPDGRVLATGANDGTVRLIEMKTSPEALRVSEGDGIVGVVAPSPDSLQFAIGSNNEARVVETETGKVVTRVPLEGLVLAADWSPDGRRLATAAEREVQIFEAATGKYLARIAPGGLVRAAAWSPNGRWLALATGARDAGAGEARILDANTFEEMSRLAHGGLVTALAWSADSRLLATGSTKTLMHGVTRILEVATGKEVARFAHDSLVSSLAWSRNGRWVAIATSSVGTKGELRVVDVATGQDVARAVYDERVASVMWGPDDQWIVIATGAWAGTIGEARILVSVTLEEIARLQPEGTSVLSVAWSPVQAFVEPSTLLTGSIDGTARLWRVFLMPQTLVEATKAKAARCLTRTERREYFLPPAPPTWCVERRLWPYHGDDWQAWLSKRKVWLASDRQGDAPALPTAP